jgi:hypothetical protein
MKYIILAMQHTLNMLFCSFEWQDVIISFVYTDGLFIVNYNSMPTTHLLGEPHTKITVQTSK